MTENPSADSAQPDRGLDVGPDHAQRAREANDAMAAEVADILLDANPWRSGWHELDEVQKTDAVAHFLGEVERFAMSNFEGRPVSRDEYEAMSGGPESAADEAPR